MTDSYKEDMLYKTLGTYEIKEPYLIAEIGINHNGDLEIAKELIKIAKVAGFDAVKFQKRNPDVCVPEAQKEKIRETPWGEMTYLEYKKKIEFCKTDYDVIDAVCKKERIEWSASPWDEDSVNFLSKYDLPWVKVASASMYDTVLLQKIGSAFDRVIISTGACDIIQVRRSYDALVSAGTMYIDVLHCNSSYPAPVEDLNLNCIISLQNEFPCANIGYSGHEYGLTPSISTIALGANIIERHVTLDKQMWGSDHSCSLEPHAMFKFCRSVRELHEALGDGDKIVTETEMAKMRSLRK